jgi:protein-S-isoprenylcysteine O-methyltransferase Ste14
MGALAPAQLLAQWTIRDERLAARTTLQMVAFIGLMLFLLPAVAIHGSQSAWSSPFTWSPLRLSVAAQLLLLPAVLGVSAVQEFVSRGKGTPVPFDPPRRLVTSGFYAYVRNPMQISAVLLLFMLGVALRSFWVSAAGVMAHVYSAGLAGWDEESDLRDRFGPRWHAYRLAVRRWWPHWRPWSASDQKPAKLFVSGECGQCREVGSWFAARNVSQLQIVAAELHPSLALNRITYEPGDGSFSASGIEAIGRALEHIHFGWAFVGAILRLPVARRLIQLIADASGGEPRSLRRALNVTSTCVAEPRPDFERSTKVT